MTQTVAMKTVKKPKQINLTEMTLSDVFRMYYVPMCVRRGLDDKTISEYRRSVDYWEELLGSPKLGDRIGEEQIELFKRGLASQPGKRPGTLMSQNTLRKHLRQIQPVIALAGPKDSKNKKGLGILQEIPDLEIPQEDYRWAEDTFSLEEIQKWLEASRRQQYADISGVKARIWWELLIRFLYSTGVRIGTLLVMKWHWVNWDNRFVQLEKHPGVKSAYLLPLNHQATETLRTMRDVSPYTRPDDLIFRWDMHERTLWTYAKRQLEQAGIPVERQYSFHALRKHFGSTVAAQNPMAATKALGHSDPAITARYYMNRKILLDNIIEELPQLDMPEENATPTVLDPPIPTALPTSPINDYSDFCGSSVVGW